MRTRLAQNDLGQARRWRCCNFIAKPGGFNFGGTELYFSTRRCLALVGDSPTSHVHVNKIIGWNDCVEDCVQAASVRLLHFDFFHVRRGVGLSLQISSMGTTHAFKVVFKLEGGRPRQEPRLVSRVTRPSLVTMSAATTSSSSTNCPCAALHA